MSRAKHTTPAKYIYTICSSTITMYDQLWEKEITQDEYTDRCARL